MPTDTPRDINEQVEREWVEETTPFERVREVIRRTYEPQPVSQVADRARTSENTARKHLEQLRDDGFVAETAIAGTRGTCYKRSNESLLVEQANRIRSTVDATTLAGRVAAMQQTVRDYREEFNADSPADAILSDREIDAKTLQSWQTTRRNLNFARVALVMSNAEQDLQASQVS